mmetsp:Transcript_16257/g.24491  ORF Transcript_16257/g.24491 Transcript_16257/m.24491 type:complete len:369 (-) Transcript_16257:108-1214(-)|eukprot:CAMPEP_0185029614 /NCGR_PEP_ID=MMETSP1103-20130426/16024_1 /TAXON_ID=36769 /ORGANISM="Paraphysomonas bandaiensis, Strain Caron Lab Isolate" /LENGTH=368 /DNA_ID=CAMNT_0027564423 /DNA_START=48 /DNA_END=1154 /DNA_ORIENTATION=+
MKWGEYLAFGVRYVEDHPDSEKKKQHVLKLVEDLFRSEGASPFSSKIAIGFLQVKLAQCPERMDRVVSYLLSRLNSCSLRTCHPLQAGCPDIIPGLRSIPFWKTSDFDWVQRLENAYPDILQEFLDMKNKGNLFQPYRAPVSGRANKTFDAHGELATDKGDWNVCYLYLHGMNDFFEKNRECCPITSQIISGLPRQHHHALFSALGPDTQVQPHHGPTNKKLRCHLPLIVPSKKPGESEPLCTLTVGDETTELIPGKCIIFDDSFLHEAQNRACRSAVGDGDPHSVGPRVVLIFDIWHPDLTAEEIKFLEFLDNAKMKAVKKYTEIIQNASSSTVSGPSTGHSDDSSTFVSVILKAKGTHVDEKKIWG